MDVPALCVSAGNSASLHDSGVCLCQTFQVPGSVGRTWAGQTFAGYRPARRTEPLPEGKRRVSGAKYAGNFRAGKKGGKIVGGRPADSCVRRAFQLAGSQDVPQRDVPPEQEFPAFGGCGGFIRRSVGMRKTFPEQRRQNRPETVAGMHIKKTGGTAGRGRHRAQNQHAASGIPDGRDIVYNRTARSGGPGSLRTVFCFSHA